MEDGLLTEAATDVTAASLGRRLGRSGEGARIRRATGTTQADLGVLLGCSGQTVSRIERGVVTPPTPLAAAYWRILDALGHLLEDPE